MATSLSTLIDRTRRYVRDWPDQDATTASMTSGATSFSVADTSIYRVNWPVEVDQETMIVRALTSSTVLTVRRNAFGSTAASHASGAAVLVDPAFYAVEYIDGLNAGLDATFPALYRQVIDTSLTALNNTYEYTIPNMPSPATQPIPIISGVDINQPGDFAYRPTDRWELRRGATPKIKFRDIPIIGSTIRINGYGPFSHLSAIADTLDAKYPAHAESLLPIYCAGWLLQSGEAGRVRADAGAVDSREQANRTGSSMSAGLQLWQRFRAELGIAAMPPLPRHVVSVF
jgi:hypothetical protein